VSQFAGELSFPQSPHKFATFLRGIMTYTQFPRNCLANVRGKYSSQNLRRNSELVMFPRRDLFVGEEEVCRRDLFVGEEEVCRRDLFVGNLRFAERTILRRI